jgi:hypothetical protein
MKRKLEILGLALFTVCAMAALSAPTAGAEQWHIGGASGTVQDTNEGESTYTINAGTAKCKTIEFNGSYAASTVSSQTVKPTYKECTAFGFINTPIDVGTCEFRFNTPVGTTSTMDIINCGATPITITSFNCWVTIGNQNGLGHIVWTNVPGTPDHVLAHFTISGTTYTQHSKSFPGCTNGTFSNGTVVGTTTYKAFVAGSQVNLTVT